MTAPTTRRTAIAADPPRTAPWISGVVPGVAVLLAATPISVVVQGGSWLAHGIAAVTVVVGVALLAEMSPRIPMVAVATAQVAALLMLLAASFTQAGVLGLVPGGGTVTEFGTLLAGAGAQIDTGIPPVPDTPEILFLATTAIGLLTVAVHLAAAGAASPATGGLPLLAAFAVPTALAADLLPWWSLAAAAAGFGLLLLAPDGDRRQLPGGVAVIGTATVAALLLGGLTGFVGTSGRFDGSGGGSGNGAIGLNPFTALRGQLDQSDPADLFEVRGLERPAYLRALTLSEYRGGAGWQATQPAPGVDVAGPFDQPAVPGEQAEVRIDNLGFRDYWLPLVGSPLAVGEVMPQRWAFDEVSGIAYATRPTGEDAWTQQAFLPQPTPELLRAAQGPDPASIYSDTRGVDQRVADIAAEVTAGATTDFDRVLALQQYFTGPDSPFTYDLATAPPAGDDALVEFLTVGQVGYCEQFASAMAIMLRTVGVPARVAVGFTAGSAAADARLIRTADAHAWVEAWFPGIGWTTFDPTPLTDGRGLVPPYVEQALRESVDDGASLEEPSVPLPAPVPQPSADPQPSPVEPEAAPGSPTPTAGGFPLWPLLAVALLVGVVSLPTLLRRRSRQHRLVGASVGGPDAAGAAWAELLAESVDRGVTVPATDTVRGAARRLVREHRLDPPSQEALRDVVAAVETSWYGGLHPKPNALAEPVDVVRAGIVTGSPLTVRARLLPRSVISRPTTRRPGHDDAAVLPV